MIGERVSTDEGPGIIVGGENGTWRVVLNKARPGHVFTTVEVPRDPSRIIPRSRYDGPGHFALVNRISYYMDISIPEARAVVASLLSQGAQIDE